MTMPTTETVLKSSGTLRTEVTGSTGWLIIDNPPRRNAMSLAMWRDLPASVEDLVRNDQVRVIVVRGAGGTSFCAGADISEFAETRSDGTKAQSYDAINVAAFKALKNAEKPVVAMIRGHCLGGGLGIALACDLRIAAEGALFGIPAARLGIAYPLDAIADILEPIGPSAAKRLLFTAERVDTETAFRIGLVDEAVAEDALETRIESLARTLGNNAPLTLRAAKRAINAFAAGRDKDALARAREAALDCFESADVVEGRDAFLEKRSPAFTGS
jgi:enoyl-CoA hydratase/carnithine racemase